MYRKIRKHHRAFVIAGMLFVVSGIPIQNQRIWQPLMLGGLTVEFFGIWLQREEDRT